MSGWVERSGKQLAPVIGSPVLVVGARGFRRGCADRPHRGGLPSRLGSMSSPRRRSIRWRPTPVVRFAPGGETRQASVASGLAVLPADVGGRGRARRRSPARDPRTDRRSTRCLSCQPMQTALSSAIRRSTRSRSSKAITVVETPDRSRFWAVQTPQIFRRARCATRMSAATARRMGRHR